MDQRPYTSEIDAATQATTLREVAHYLYWESPHAGEVSQESAAKIARDALYLVLKRFRPELIAATGPGERPAECETCGNTDPDLFDVFDATWVCVGCVGATECGECGEFIPDSEPSTISGRHDEKCSLYPKLP